MSNEQRLTAALETIREAIRAYNQKGNLAESSHRTPPPNLHAAAPRGAATSRAELLADLHHLASVALGKPDSAPRTPEVGASAAQFAPPPPTAA